jgi:hypothetical protein
MNLLGDIINTIKNREVLMNANKKVVLEANSEKTKYILKSHHQNAEHDHNIKTTMDTSNIWQSSDIWE